MGISSILIRKKVVGNHCEMDIPLAGSLNINSVVLLIKF